MPLTLSVDTAAWHARLRARLAADPGLVPVAKGNGYGFGVPLLARTAAGLGTGMLAVGSAAEASAALPAFPGEVIVLDAEPAAPVPGAGRRVLYTAGSVAAAAALAGRRRLIVECRTSLLRQGITEADLPALWQTTGGGRAIEAFAVHLPIDRPAGADPDGQTARWVRTLEAAGFRVATLYVSHLTAAELAALSAAFPGTRFRQRTGTALWLGDGLDALRATSTVLQAVPVRRGERLGYRQYRSRRDGWLVLAAGGTAHGVGLETAGARRGVQPRARALARGALAAAGRVRSPFSWQGRRLWFAEPPHMLVSMLALPAGVPPPQPGAELRASLRYTTAQFDQVTLSACGCPACPAGSRLRAATAGALAC